MEKMAVVAPMPNAKVSTAAKVQSGRLAELPQRIAQVLQ